MRGLKKNCTRWRRQTHTQTHGHGDLLKIIFWVFYGFSPTRPHWAELVIESPCPSVCLSVCACVCAVGCSFFLGLSLALRSHDQFQASGIMSSFVLKISPHFVQSAGCFSSMCFSRYSLLLKKDEQALHMCSSTGSSTSVVT